MEALLIAGVLLGLIGSAFYSGLETGIFSVNPLRLNHLLRKKVKNADILKEFIDHPDHLLGTALVGNNLCNVIASVAAVMLGTRMGGELGYTLGYIGITVFMLILGEYMPKAWFQGQPALRVLPFVRLLKWNGVVFGPVSRAVTWIASILMPIPARAEGKVTPLLTREDLHHLTEETRQTGALSRNEGALMKRVFKLSALTCQDLMKPIEEVITIDSESSAEKIISISRENNISRFPVWSRESNRFGGIVYIFDLLSDPEPAGKTAADYLRAPQFVGADSMVEELLPRMRRTRQPMAFVIDASANVIGILTTEDILKRIVGPL